MKAITLKFIAKLLLSLLPLLFTNCTNEVTVELTANDTATGLSICAKKGLFTDSEAIQTRLSTSNNYLTTFTEGDQIGITIINSSGSVDYEYNNICYTYQSATKQWVTKGSNPPIYNDATVTYIAYYPYDEKMNSKLTSSDIINSFIPQANQSTLEGHNLSDLMTATGVLNSTAQTLTFNFVHQMSLYEFHLTGKTYKTTTNNYEYSIPLENGKGTISATVDGIETVLYYNSDNDVYRLLAKPNASVNYTASITSAGTTYKAINQPLTSLSVSGIYKRYKIRCGSPENRDLKVCDRYYLDGSILPIDFAYFNPTNNPCIGVIFQVGEAYYENASNYDGKLAYSYINGYVMALGVYGSGNYGNFTAGDENSGYQNTKNIHNAAINSGSGKVNGVIESAYQYESVYPTRKGTSGWYIPAKNQMSSMYGNRTQLGNSVGKSIFPSYTGTSTASGSKWWVAGENRLYTTPQINAAAPVPAFTF